MRRLAPILLVAVPLVTRADDAYEGGGLKVIAPISVHAHLDGMTAVMTARFSIAAGSGETDYTFTKPIGAAITGAIVTSEGTAHRLVLERDAAATAHFRDVQIATSKDPIRRSAAIVTVFDVDATIGVLAHRAGSITVELEMTVPACFDDDARFVGVSDAWLPAIDPALKQGAPKDIEARCTALGENMAWIGFPSKELASRPSGEARVGATAGRLAIGNTHLTRVEVDIAGTLADIPPDLATVILIDGSRSMSRGALDTQREIVNSYVRSAKATRVQVIAYARTPHPLLPSWSMASAIAPRLDREIHALVRRNGSNVDAGIREAGAWLSRIAGTRRVVLLTDELVPNRLAGDGVAWKTLLPPGTLVHVVTVEAGAETLVSNSGGAMFVGLATTTGGVAVRGGASVENPHASEMLVHPISLDELAVRPEGWVFIDLIPGCTLDERALHQGGSCTFWFSGNAHSGPIVIEGTIWGVPVKRIVRADPRNGMALARELVGRSAPLDEDKRKLVEDAAHAVSTGWSLFAAWGGTAGYGGELGAGRFGRGGGGDGCCAGFGDSSSGIRSIEPPHPDLRWQLYRALRACHAERERVEVTLETTFEEIVDVAVTAETGTIATCVEEAIWETTLAIDRPASHALNTFELGPLVR